MEKGTSGEGVEINLVSVRACTTCRQKTLTTDTVPNAHQTSTPIACATRKMTGRGQEVVNVGH